MFLLGAVQCLADRADGVLRGEGTVQEVTGARLLHDLCVKLDRNYMWVSLIEYTCII